MDSARRASLRLSKIAPGDFVTAFKPGYLLSKTLKLSAIPL
jgi:hypothetical protein